MRFALQIGSGNDVGMSLRNIFRERVAALLAESGQKQTPLAKKAKLAEGTMRQALSPTGVSPKLDTVEKIATALGVSAVELLGGSGELNRDLFLSVGDVVFRDVIPERMDRQALLEALALAYEFSRRRKVSPRNQREMDLVAAPLIEKLLSAKRPPQSP